MATKDDLERWWAGLSPEERADAIRSGEVGKLRDRLRRSLQKAGLLDPGKREDRDIPGDVSVFLKTRH